MTKKFLSGTWLPLGWDWGTLSTSKKVVFVLSWAVLTVATFLLIAWGAGSGGGGGGEQTEEDLERAAPARLGRTLACAGLAVLVYTFLLFASGRVNSGGEMTDGPYSFRPHREQVVSPGPVNVTLA
jgi:hypothetical protein